MNAETQLETDFKNWLTAISRENIPQNIAAWSFELSEPYEITLVGSTHFDESNNDWACPDDDDFHPATAAPDLSVLSGQNWEIVLETVVNIVRKLTVELPDLAVFRVPHIAAGFVDGDLVLIR